MARKRFSDEDVIRLLRQIEVELASGATVATACRSTGVSDATYYGWRKQWPPHSPGCYFTYQLGFSGVMIMCALAAAFALCTYLYVYRKLSKITADI